ncbi:ABC transporter permease, partial [Geobacillus sp. MMMUD3]|nr:ABC transporter permease [Geobacillus sp. MMMUD3]
MSKKNTFARRTPTDIGLNVWGILVFIYLFIPIAVIIAYSFNTGRVLAAFRGFGLDAYITGLNNDIIISSVVTSLQAAVGAAIVSTVFGTLGGVALARAPKGAWWALGL